MTPEEKGLLFKTAELTKENNALLRAMRRGARIRGVLHALYWVVIVGLSFGAYYFLEPYIAQVQNIYQGIQGDIDNVRGTANSLGDFGALLKR